MVLTLLQTLRLNRSSTEKMASSKTDTSTLRKLKFIKAPHQAQRNSDKGKTKGQVNSTITNVEVANHSVVDASKFDIFERGPEDSDDDDLLGMIVRPVRVPNSQTLNMKVLAHPNDIDSTTFTPGSLLNPIQREAYSPPHTYESKQEYVKSSEEDESKQEYTEQSEDDEEVPLAFVKFRVLRQKSAFEDLQMPSEGWSFSRRAISYDQLHYTLQPKSDDSASDDDSDELYFDACYDLQFHPQRHSIDDDHILRHSMSAPKVTLLSTKQAKPVHVQVEEAMSAQTVHVD
ncbi:hypothetical protein K450DRAFT_267876 [Umbelopsis ramanniana AG]|uniref:Uncharacterized protein n=1 Tax=Umbelopsis ramanniana AG TaxID=1314678 RepID=A0AAD5EIU7_UMBRA|nr:uncharacterized protein K450DRAFT_267876 [Umbelopsis ramanniana AG]KAI8583865.1 hypothetical protein K450DRAFT_267876 [Umbelopsis ramanniana AG]